MPAAKLPGPCAPPAAGAGRAALSEADLARLWEAQSFPAEALTTRAGERLRVVYRGRRRGGPGPDFRDAVIAAPSGLLRGDVELHTRSSDFRRHGHHRDAAYNGLALHVAFWQDEDGDTVLEDGRRVPVVGLADWLAARSEEIRRWLSRPALWREPCRSAVARLEAGAVGRALERLGDKRFRQKTAAWAKRLREEDRESLLWEGLLEALGYGGDREAFRGLARRLPWREVRSRLLAVPAGRRAGLAAALLADAAGAADLAAGRRPGTRGPPPWRRLEGAAQIAARLAGEGPSASLTPPPDRRPRDAVRALLAQLAVPGAVGRGRALEVLTNVVLPLAAAEAALAPAAEAAYRSLPLPVPYGAVRHLHQALQGVPVDARRQQGMLYLLRRYCSRGGCGRCPLS